MSRDWSKTRGGPTREQELLVQRLRLAKAEAARTGQKLSVRDDDGEIIAVVSVDYFRDRDISADDPVDQYRPFATVRLTRIGFERLPKPWNT